MRFKDRVAELLSFFKVPKQTISKLLALTIIYIIGLVLRLQPLILHGANYRAYDPFIQIKATQILLEKGLLGMLEYYDFKYWYPFGSSLSVLYIMVPLLGATIYKLFNVLGIHIDLLTAVTVTPAILGSFCIIVVYALGREVKNSNVGLIAALLTSISPGFLQRSIAGFYDNEMSILFVMLMFLFFLRAAKRGSAIDAVLSGFFGGLICWSWGIWRYAIIMIAVHTFLRIVSRTADSKDLSAYAITILIAVGMSIMIPRNYGSITSMETAICLGVLILVFFDYLAKYFSNMFGKTYYQMYKILVGAGLVVTILGILILSTMGHLKTITGKFASILNPFLREEIIAYTSVAENQPGIWSNFYMGVGLGIIFVPLSLLAMIERRDKSDLLLFLLVVTSFYFAASITRYIVLGSPILSIAVGLGIDYMLEPYTRFLTKRYVLHQSRVVRIFLGERRPPKGVATAVYATIFIILIVSVNQCMTLARYYGGYDYTNAEREIFDYLHRYAKPTDVVLSWWDYGYRCTVISNTTTLADNGTRNSTQMGVVGSMLMLPPEKAIILMRKYRVRWVLVYSVDIAKSIWMIKIASKYAPVYGVSEEKYFNEEESKYKEPFFHSVLWQLLAYKDDTLVARWVKNYGEKQLSDKSNEFKVANLVYFKFIMKKTMGNEFVKLYKVIWPKDLDNVASLPWTFNASSVVSEEKRE